MPEKLIVHAGFHKTATTALQDFMTKAVPEAAPGRAYWFPRPFLRRELAVILAKRDVSRLGHMVSSRPEGVLFLSEENISGELTPEGGELCPKFEERLNLIFDAVPGVSVEVVVVLRDWASFVPAAYLQYIRHRPYKSFAAYWGALDRDKLCFDAILAFRERLPPRVSLKILPYEERYGGGLSALTDFLCRSGGLPPLSSQLPSERVYTSMTMGELRFGRLIGSVSPNFSPAVLQRLAQPESKLAPLKSLLDRFDAKKFRPFAEEERHALHERYLEDLATLKPWLAEGVSSALRLA